MQYPTMGRMREYRVSVPELNGGVNTSLPQHMIADNQLADVKNMWYRRGMLKTRPALSGVGSADHDADVNLRYGSVGAHGYIAGVSSQYNYVTLVNEDGTTVPHRAKNRGAPDSISMMPTAVNGGLPSSVCTDDVIVYMKGEAEGDTGVFSVSAEAENYTRTALSPYVPTVMINGRPQASLARALNGDQLEPYNMLTDEYLCTFTPDGKGLYYQLPEANATVLEIIYNGRLRKNSGHGQEKIVHTLVLDEDSGLYVDTSSDKSSGYLAAYDSTQGCVYFVETPTETASFPDFTVPVAVREGADNSITVRLRRTDTEAFKTSRDTILGMRFSTWFGGGTEGLSGGTRLFVGGNPDHPNVVHWSALNNPLYFPENNYAYVGEDTNAVTAFGKQSDMLVIFKERELYYTTYNRGGTVSAENIESQTVVDIEAAAAVFPMIQLHPEIGCDCPGTVQLCNNRLVWLNSDSRVYGLFSAGAYSERNLRVLSLQVEKDLRAFDKATLTAASATRFEEQYLLLIGGKLLVMDFSSYGFNYYSSYSTDEKAQKNVVWHHWDTGVALIAAIRVGNTAVLIGTDGVDGHRRTFLLKEGKTCDDKPENNTFTATSPIVSHLRTKLYDLGHSDRRKRVNSLYLKVSGEQGKRVFLGYFDGKQAYENRDILLLTGDGPDAAAPFRVTPNMLRVRQFALSLTSDGYIEVGGIVLNYSMMGAWR